MNLSKEDFDSLLEMIETDPDFVDEYLEKNQILQLSVPQCAKALKVSEPTILYRIRIGKLKAEKDNSGHWKIEVKDLKNYIKNEEKTEDKEEKTEEIKFSLNDPRLKGSSHWDTVEPLSGQNLEILAQRLARQKKLGDLAQNLEPQEPEKKGIKMQFKYDKSSSQNVLDFLHDWEKANTVGFATQTVLKDFNAVCATRTTLSQMGGILSTLTKNNLLVRKMKGIYAMPEGFFAKSQSFAPIDSIEKLNQHNQQTQDEPVAHAVPVIERPAISGRELEKLAQKDKSWAKTGFQESAESADVKKTYAHHWEEMKHKERILVDKFLNQFADPTKDFVFTISDVYKHYPKSNREKLSKAIQNMAYNQKLEKGKKLGEYIKKASVAVSSTEPLLESSRSTRLEEVLKMNISDDLRAKIIKEIISGT